jgi:hypothetical protein
MMIEATIVALLPAIDEDYNSIFRNRNAFKMTETELKVIAALAIIGLRRTPTNG